MFEVVVPRPMFVAPRRCLVLVPSPVPAPCLQWLRAVAPVGASAHAAAPGQSRRRGGGGALKCAPRHMAKRRRRRQHPQQRQRPAHRRRLCEQRAVANHGRRGCDLVRTSSPRSAEQRNNGGDWEGGLSKFKLVERPDPALQRKTLPFQSHSQSKPHRSPLSLSLSVVYVCLSDGRRWLRRCATRRVGLGPTPLRPRGRAARVAPPRRPLGWPGGFVGGVTRALVGPLDGSSYAVCVFMCVYSCVARQLSQQVRLRRNRRRRACPSLRRGSS
jgi:hypothetical protein